MAKSPAAILFDTDGIELAVKSAIAIPANTRGILAMGSDGTNARYLKVSSTGVVSVDGSAVTQPVSGTFWQATQPVSIAATVAVSGPLTDTQLRASPVPTSAAQSGTWNINNVSGTVSLPTGAATESTLATLLTAAAFQARIPVNGQAVMSASVPVVIASNQSVIPINDNSGSITVDTPQLPSSLVGGRLDANVGAWLGSTAPTVGQKTMSDGIPVSIASDQSAIPVSQSGTWNINNVSGTVSLPTGAATAANQTTIGNQTTKINDGTNTAAVKAASTAAVASDPALVVAFSPNSALPGVVTGGYGGQVEGRAASGVSAVGNPVLTGGLDGSTARSIAVDSVGRIITAPAGSSSVAAGFRMGYVVTASTTTVPIRATAYTEQTTNSQRSLVSASASDTAAGTGAQTVKITYLTATFTGPFEETVTMNGTTPVNTVATNICYIERIEVVTAGSTGSNVGVITLRAAAAGGGAVVWTIAATDNRTFGLHHYTPTGLTTYITAMSTAHSGTTVGSGAMMFLRSKDLTNAASVERQVSDFHRQFGQEGTTTRNFGTPIEVVGPARTTMFVAPEGSGSVTYRGAFDFYDQ